MKSTFTKTFKNVKHQIDNPCANDYNFNVAEVAQVVEQRTENPRVSGSTPLLGTNYLIVENSRICSRMPPCNGRIVNGYWIFLLKCAEVAEW